MRHKTAGCGAAHSPTHGVNVGILPVKRVLGRASEGGQHIGSVAQQEPRSLGDLLNKRAVLQRRDFLGRIEDGRALEARRELAHVGIIQARALRALSEQHQREPQAPESRRQLIHERPDLVFRHVVGLSRPAPRLPRQARRQRHASEHVAGADRHRVVAELKAPALVARLSDAEPIRVGAMKLKPVAEGLKVGGEATLVIDAVVDKLVLQPQRR
mmetsp:Transcript_10484/g.31631  ORF Transcript_10484/g.31631 Transcript_10484/m.31631 type:complete len:214 (-) Transcript_10484:216-857(-)